MGISKTVRDTGLLKNRGKIVEFGVQSYAVLTFKKILLLPKYTKKYEIFEKRFYYIVSLFDEII